MGMSNDLKIILGVITGYLIVVIANILILRYLDWKLRNRH